MASGEKPIKVAEVEIKSARLLLYDEARFMKFLDKPNLDAERSLINSKIIYKDSFDSTSSQIYTKHLASTGYEIFTIIHSCAA